MLYNIQFIDIKYNNSLYICDKHDKKKSIYPTHVALNVKGGCYSVLDQRSHENLFIFYFLLISYFFLF